jgi:IS1 family transposase
MPKGYTRPTKLSPHPGYLRNNGIEVDETASRVTVVLNWIKKTQAVWISQETKFDAFELDEVFWYIKTRKGYENGINTYIMTMISRLPRQILGFGVENSVESKTVQAMVDSVPAAEKYFTDGGHAYMDVIFGGKHIRNAENKKDTHEIESTNADLRHYIAGLARRSRCFFRSRETLCAVLSVLIDAYNKYGEAKLKYRKPVVHKTPNSNQHLHKYRDFPFSILDFL